MATITVPITVAPNSCRDVIGVRGLCENTYPYYLDIYGVSLDKAVKLADSSMITGRQLVEEMVNEAWGSVFDDLRADGFLVNGVQKIFKYIFTESTKISGTYTIEINRSCDIENIHIGIIKVKAIGTLNAVLTVNVDGIITELYNDSLTDETLSVIVDKSYNAESVIFELITTGSGVLQASDNNSVFNLNAYTECSENLFYCKYWAYLVKAVMFKASATILNASLLSDRYNDLIVYKKDEIAIRVSQLDSSLNLLSGGGKINENGLYQLEIEKVNLKLKEIVKKSYCTSCFECNEIITTRISIP